jgi:uncharacterized peroxidase-related enzyme
VRPAVLDHGYGLGPRILFRLIRVFSGHSVPDAAKIMFFRPDFYGAPMKALTHDVMRGHSAWSVGDRELMAAYVSRLNECPFCVGAHTATASRAYHDQNRVDATLADLDAAPIEEPLRATLKMLGKLTTVGTLHVDDILSLLADGATAQQVEEALAVCFAFNTTNRVANAFGFEVLSPEGFEAGAKYLLTRGYR